VNVESEGSPGPLALVGSGEYLESMLEVEGSLLDGRPPRYVQLATAAVPDGDKVVQHWHDLGTAQARRLGVTPVIVPVTDRTSADNDDFAAQIKGAGLIYLSGGDPGYLADTLRDTAVWAAIVAAWRGGAALAGCSAGAMVLGPWIPSLRDLGRRGTPGLGLLPHVRVIPHFDRFIKRLPDVALVRPDQDAGVNVVGVDEETALIGGPTSWVVQGRQSVWRLSDRARQSFPAGSTLVTPA
jgi:cyanophycinase